MIIKHLNLFKINRIHQLNTIKYATKPKTNDLILFDKHFIKDDYTNVTEKVLSYIGKNLHTKQHHPLSLVRQRIVNYFYKSFVNNRGNPIFSIYDNLSPLVSIEQNFNSLLIPANHPSRSKSDCYYINRDYLLRAHMTAHQSELISSGLNDFIMVGDVFRRDEIDRTHYPIFHQMDAVRLRTKNELFPNDGDLEIFDNGHTTDQFCGEQQKQACHTLEAVKLMEFELKSTLQGLAKELFGQEVQYRWVDTTFPFTQPSWELEVLHEGDWLELLGCGIMQQTILKNAGVTNRIGWAFGLGLERIAMCSYQIPDIRLFWSTDSGFSNQFKTDNIYKNIIYKPISQFPQCANDISFWLPKDEEFSSNDFYDLVRTIGGDLIEQVELIDNFTHPKNGKTSHCYRIVYRHMERTLTQDEVNLVHKQIENEAAQRLGVVIR